MKIHFTPCDQNLRCFPRPGPQRLQVRGHPEGLEWPATSRRELSHGTPEPRAQSHQDLTRIIPASAPGYRLGAHSCRHARRLPAVSMSLVSAVDQQLPVPGEVSVPWVLPFFWPSYVTSHKPSDDPCIRRQQSLSPLFKPSDTLWTRPENQKVALPSEVACSCNSSAPSLTGAMTIAPSGRCRTK